MELGYDEIHRFFGSMAAEQETMEEAKWRGADLNRILATLAFLKKRKEESASDRPRVVVNFVAQADNIHELPDLVRKLADLNVFFLGVNALLAPSGNADSNGKYAALYRECSLAALKPRALVENAIEEALNAWPPRPGYHSPPISTLDALYHPGRFTGLVQLIRQEEGKPAPDKLTPYYCAYPWTSTYVHANAGARICCFMSGRLGNVNDADDLDHVWNNGLITEIRDAVSHGEVHANCAQCVSQGRYQHSYVDLNSAAKLLGVADLQSPR